MIYMICYDIRSPKRLRKTAKILENFGLRVQKSFFQCEISTKGMEELKRNILSEINVKEDYFSIYPLCEQCSKKAVQDGPGELVKLEAFEIY